MHYVLVNPIESAVRRLIGYVRKRVKKAVTAVRNVARTAAKAGVTKAVATKAKRSYTKTYKQLRKIQLKFLEAAMRHNHKRLAAGLLTQDQFDKLMAPLNRAHNVLSKIRSSHTVARRTPRGCEKKVGPSQDKSGRRINPRHHLYKVHISPEQRRKNKLTDGAEVRFVKPKGGIELQAA